MQKTFFVLKCLIIGLMVEKEIRRNRISQRFKDRLDAGMVDEVRSLLDEWIKEEDLIYYNLEYKYITLYLTGKLDYDDMVRHN